MSSFATKFTIGTTDEDGYLLVNIAGTNIDAYGNLFVNLNNNLKIGDSYGQTIDDTERVLDLTFLVSASDYPMDIELESRDVACFVKQGDSSVSLDATYNARINADQWRKINVANENEAYVAVKNTSLGDAGSLVATRLDKV